MKEDIESKRIRVYGIVQGVGFRPFTARIACISGIKGSVCNKGPFVEIYARGSKKEVEDFLYRLENEAPERSAILKIETEEIQKDEREERGESKESGGSFQIIESEKVSGEVFVSPDIATCKKCEAELFDKKNRRYLHPFINCTACGPRLTILDSMPYDRVRTSMKDFPMCKECEIEYTTQSTRRYHAQPVCCNACGPRIIVIHPFGMREKSNNDAIIMARKVIMEGGIAAVKGIGGFHLCCNAEDESAVNRLRRLKDRKTKPFAVMMKNIDVAKEECYVSKEAENILSGHNKPILLLKRKENSTLCHSIAPNNPKVGVMLPYAPVQMLLFNYPDGMKFCNTLVMTSGNPRGAPICRTDSEALETLKPMSDIILSNNRVIRLRADDSVADWDSEKEKMVMIRRSRGYAPLPIMIDSKEDGKKSVLAIGGELKNTFCLSRGGLYYLSPYIGDMADIRSIEALRLAIERMERLLEIAPKRIVFDKHPLYNTSTVAKEIAKEKSVPVLEVQHHWAHAASCMAENGLCNKDEKVIAITFDGTGYGDDKSIWGGEVLISSYTSFIRAASIEPFRQSGGDIASREGWRIAVSLLEDEAVFALNIARKEEVQSVRFMEKNNINTVTSTSCGRLFDAVSAVLKLCRISSFEGEAAMRVQAAAEEVEEKEKQRITIECKEKAKEIKGRLLDGRYCLPTTKLIQEIARRALQGDKSNTLSYYFHEMLSLMVVDAVKYCKEHYADMCHFSSTTVALTGGVFINTLFRSLCRRHLEEEGFNVIVHTLVPAGDGGIALGQAVIGAMADSDGKIL